MNDWSLFKLPHADLLGCDVRVYNPKGLPVRDPSLEDDPKSFIFDQSWNNVFLYGKEVKDFLKLEKNKLFTLNFSATQEIDRIQQVEKAKLAAAETEITTLKSTVETQQTTINNQQTTINTLQSTLAALEARIAALENP